MSEMLEVEWMGGPEDGAMIHVPEGCREIRVPILELPEDWQDGGLHNASFHVLNLPIEVMEGRLIVRYKEIA